MEITPYRRHSENCKHKDDRYHPRCGCPLWFQFNWSGQNTILNGNKLRRGQNKWSAETRIWSEAETNKKRLDSELTALLEGKPVRQNITVQAAIEEWLKFKEQNGLGIKKAKLMGGKLVAWCEVNEVILLTALTPERVMKFRTSLPYRTGDSSSLSVHWAVINGFFGWAVGMGYIEKSPSPNTRVFPQFRIKYEQREVVPPTEQEVEKVLATATGQVGLLIRLMRESGMALVDAHKFGMSVADGEKYGVSKPERRPIVKGTVIRGNRTKTNERYRVLISQSLAEQLEALGTPAFPDTYVKWREDVNKAIRQAGVKMTPHGFRHFRITEWLSHGVRPDHVAAYVGTVAAETMLRRKKAAQRVDPTRAEDWMWCPLHLVCSSCAKVLTFDKG